MSPWPDDVCCWPMLTVVSSHWCWCAVVTGHGCCGHCCCLPVLCRSPTLQLTAESELPRPGRTELPAPAALCLRNTEQSLGSLAAWDAPAGRTQSQRSPGPGHVVMTAGRARADHKLAKLLQRRVASVSQISVSHSTTLLRSGLLWPAPASRQMTAFCKLPGVAPLAPTPQLSSLAAAPSRMLLGNWDQLAAGDCSLTDNQYQDTGLSSPVLVRGGGCTILCVGLDRGWIPPPPSLA